MDEQQRAYLRRVDKYVLDPDEDVEYYERLALGKNMLYNLVRTLDKDKYRPIEFEQEYSAPIVTDTGDQLYCTCERCWYKAKDWILVQTGNRRPSEEGWTGLPVVFCCRIDAVFEDRKGSLYIVDHKSAAQLMSLDDIDELQRDLQLGSYSWVVNYGGRRVTGAIYNQFRKAYPKPPKRLTAGTRMFSTSRMQLTDYYTARRYFKTDKWAWQRGLYDEYLAWLKNAGKKDFFRQFIIPKSDEQLEQAGQLLRSYAAELIADPMPYPNPSVPFVCKRCKFSEPCLTMYEGLDPADEFAASFVQEDLLWYEQERLERLSLWSGPIFAAIRTTCLSLYEMTGPCQHKRSQRYHLGALSS
jgi:hypothetical protein